MIKSCLNPRIFFQKGGEIIMNLQLDLEKVVSGPSLAKGEKKEDKKKPTYTGKIGYDEQRGPYAEGSSGC